MLASAHWSLAPTKPDQIADVRQLDCPGLQWVDAIVPGTVAQALQAARQWDIDSQVDFDDRDWWYRCSFEHRGGGDEHWLHFHGLATLAQVWLNGEVVLETSNMFERYSVDVSGLLQPQNDLAIRFRALNTALAKRRPRPRWKTKLVRNQQLRWFRTTLLGRIPGWSPPVAPVGPWRPIVLEERNNHAVTDVDVRPHVDGTTGVIDFKCAVSVKSNSTVWGTLSSGDSSTELAVERVDGECRLSGRLRVENAALWWPHTHGEPALHDCEARISVDGETQSVDCGRVGFRTVEANQNAGDFELRVNGVPVFCRGACWTINDIVSMTGTAQDYRKPLKLLRDAGGNMIRIGGTMVYEDDAFYRLCDELGILVWQDFMFANMDYPADDPRFVAAVQSEATQQLQRLHRHAAVAVYCGGSEVEQQAAMVGSPREIWRNTLFSEVLPELCERWHPDTVYVPSTPSGGTMPFHTSTGVTHYYGVGAYLRPIEDARRANVRFTSETLAFANVPDNAIVDAVMQGDTPAIHDPRWKRRTPRDTGAGWDFEDVRDHYLRDLFAVDPTELRWSDMPRYLELSRVTTGECMSRVFSEWRSPRSTCHGGLVWFFNDLWPGAGWGVIDSRGEPKACFYYLRRVWQPRTVVLTDEGLNGVHAHVVNDTSEPLNATLEWTLLRDGHVVIARQTTPCEVAPRSTITSEAEAALGAFYDTAYAYRFGPPKHDVTAARLLGPDGGVIAEAFHFPQSSEPKRVIGSTIVAEALPICENRWKVTLQSDRFLYAVHFDAAGCVADDNYFHLMPGATKTVVLRRIEAGEGLCGYVEALNLDDPVRIAVKA
jgi:beta-mannosidase